MGRLRTKIKQDLVIRGLGKQASRTPAARSAWVVLAHTPTTASIEQTVGKRQPAEHAGRTRRPNTPENG